MGINLLKELIKKTPLIRVYRHIKNRLNYRRLMYYNNLYKKNIKPMMEDDIYRKKATELFKIVGAQKKVYYVIGIAHDKTGIFGYINNFMPHIAYAVAKGYLPIIDMKSYPSIYQVHQENAWENYFEQPVNIGLETANGNAIKYGPDDLWYRWAPNSCPIMSNEEILFWGDIYKSFVRYNTKTQTYLDKELNDVLKSPEKTVGVIYRGTDYTQGKPVGCPIQPTMKMLADKVEEMLASQNCEYIYLASDEKKIVDYMNSRFPGRVLINKRVFYDEATNVDYTNYNNDHIGISGAKFDRNNHKYLIGIEYISTINLVAHCACLVAGACGGTTAALYINHLQYKERYIFELGKYGYDDVPEE